MAKKTSKSKKSQKDEGRKQLIELIELSGKDESIRGLDLENVIYDEVNVDSESKLAAEEPQGGAEDVLSEDVAQGSNSTSEAAHVAPAKKIRPLQTAAKLGHILQGKSRRVRKYIPFSTKH